MVLRKIGLSCLFAVGLFGQTAQASEIQPPQANAVFDFVLPVNEPQVIVNQFLWTIKAACVINSESDYNFLSFKVLRKSGSFNGTKLTDGSFMDVTVANNDKIYITALPGAQVELTNKGNTSITASCNMS